MITRRTLVFLILSVALLAPATAQAQKPKPVRNVPKLFLTLTDGAANNKTVSPTITTSFSPPKGTTAATACKGKVLVKAPTGTKTVKKKKVTVFAKRTASVKNVAGICTSAATLKLPAALKDKTVKFKSVFEGNAAVRGFTKVSKLKVSVTPAPAPTLPAPPPTIYPGKWSAQLTISGPDPDPRWQFEVKPDGSVAGITMTGSYPATCPSGFTDAVTTFSHANPFSYVGDTATLRFHNVGTGNGGLPYDVTTDFWFILYAAGTGLGTIKATGSFVSTQGGNFATAQCSFGSHELLLTRLAPGTD